MQRFCVLPVFLADSRNCHHDISVTVQPVTALCLLCLLFIFTFTAQTRFLGKTTQPTTPAAAPFTSPGTSLSDHCRVQLSLAHAPDLSLVFFIALLLYCSQISQHPQPQLYHCTEGGDQTAPRAPKSRTPRSRPRLDSNGNYAAGNVASCCAACNVECCEAAADTFTVCICMYIVCIYFIYKTQLRKHRTPRPDI